MGPRARGRRAAAAARRPGARLDHASSATATATATSSTSGSPTGASATRAGRTRPIRVRLRRRHAGPRPAGAGRGAGVRRTPPTWPGPTSPPRPATSRWPRAGASGPRAAGRVQPRLLGRRARAGWRWRSTATSSPVDALASNVGHCLWSGIVDEDKAAVAGQAPAWPTTCSPGGASARWARRWAAYDPLGPHTGAVWPHDNALCVAGLIRYGFVDEAHRLVLAQLEAAAAGGGRMAVLCGFDRDDVAGPVRLPDGCDTRAWSAAAPLLHLRSLLRFDPHVPQGKLWLSPVLPDAIRSLRVERIPLLGGSVTVTVDGRLGRRSTTCPRASRSWPSRGARWPPAPEPRRCVRRRGRLGSGRHARRPSAPTAESAVPRPDAAPVAAPRLELDPRRNTCRRMPPTRPAANPVGRPRPTRALRRGGVSPRRPPLPARPRPATHRSPDTRPSRATRPRARRPGPATAAPRATARSPACRARPRSAARCCRS